MAKVREVEPTDFETLLDMAHAMHAESPELQELTFNQGRALDTLVSVFQSYREIVNGWVLVDKDEIIGALFGTVSNTFYSDDLVAHDLVVYVKPEHRGSPFGVVKMVRAYEAWARERGAKITYISISTGIEAERSRGVFERLGYKAIGPILKKQ